MSNVSRPSCHNPHHFSLHPRMPTSLDIVIVGTGIGGLTAASALANKGHRVTVLEATSKLQAIGGVIVMAANACRVLDQLGLYDALLGICAEQPMVRFHRRYTGEKFAEVPAAHSLELYGYPYAHRLRCAISS